MKTGRDQSRHCLGVVGGVVLAAVVLASAGCSKVAMTQEEIAASDQMALTRSPDGPTDTGSYPNLNIAPRAAAEQFTTHERAAKNAALQAARVRQPPVTVDAATRARKAQLLLARKRQQDVLRDIEGN